MMMFIVFGSIVFSLYLLSVLTLGLAFHFARKDWSRAKS